MLYLLLSVLYVDADSQGDQPDGTFLLINLSNVPTGYGRLLCYQELPFSPRGGKMADAVPVVLEVSPLLALMQGQVHKLRQYLGPNRCFCQKSLH